MRKAAWMPCVFEKSTSCRPTTVDNFISAVCVYQRSCQTTGCSVIQEVHTDWQHFTKSHRRPKTTAKCSWSAHGLQQRVLLHKVSLSSQFLSYCLCIFFSLTLNRSLLAFRRGWHFLLAPRLGYELNVKALKVSVMFKRWTWSRNGKLACFRRCFAASARG